MISRSKQWGVFLHWPHAGTDWIHDEDVMLAERLIPSSRVFSRVDLDHQYNLITYGRHQIRIKPALWLETPEPEFELGDRVAIKSDGGRLEPLLGSVREVLWDPRLRAMTFQLTRTGRKIPRLYLAKDLQAIAPLGGHLNSRQLCRRKQLGLV